MKNALLSVVLSSYNSYISSLKNANDDLKIEIKVIKRIGQAKVNKI
jgi:hypothetical protein